LNGDGKIDDYLNANESVQWLRGTYNNPIGVISEFLITLDLKDILNLYE